MCHRPADYRHSRHLEIEHMASLFDDDFLAGFGMKSYGNLISHGSGWNKQRGIFSKDVCGALLEFYDAGVFAVDVIADFSCCHSLSHFIGRRGYRIASKIDVFQEASFMTAECLAEENKARRRLLSSMSGV